MVIMQALLPDEEVASKPSSPTVTWREPVEVFTENEVSAGAENRFVSSHTCNGTSIAQGSRPLSSGLDAATPTTTSSRCGSGDTDSRNAQTEHPSGIPESVLVVPVQDIPIITTDLGIRKGIRSRSRPRRTDEPVPFLSVDTLPVDKVVIDGTCPALKTARPVSGRRFTRSPKKQKDSTGLTNSKDCSVSGGSGRRAPRTPHPMSYGSRQGSSTSRASSNSHNYNSFFTHKNSAFLSGPPSLWSAGNKYWPHNNFPAEKRRGPAFPPVTIVEATSAKPNQHVTQPFKHDVDAPPAMERPVSPSQDLKERTLRAVWEVAKDLAKKTPPPTHTRNGRLLKGKLKPLHTFKLQGPSIEECKGIQAEERLTHTPSQARMMQRKRELLNKLPSDVFQTLTEKSVYHTTGAEDVSVGYDLGIVSAIKTEEMSHRPPDNELVQMLAFTRMPPNSLASIDSVYDAAEHDVAISPSLQDTLITTIEVPDEDNNDHLKFIVFENLENRHSTEVPPNKHQTLNLSTTGIGKQRESSATASSEATMSDYLNEGGAASIILSDMVDRVKHSAQRMSEEAAEAVNGAFNDSMLVSSELASRGSDTPTYRSIASDDVAFDSASQWSARFSENSNYDFEANGEVLQVDQTEISVASDIINVEQSHVPTGNSILEVHVPSVNEEQQELDTPNKLCGDIVNSSNAELVQNESEDLKQSVKLRFKEHPSCGQSCTNDNVTSNQKPSSAISMDLQGSASDVRNTLLSMSGLSPSVQVMVTCPDSNQSVSNATDKSEPSKAKENNDEGDTKESKQKPLSAESTDLQGSASDVRNTLLSMSVLSPSTQVIETCPDSVLTNQPVSNATDKSEPSKAKENNDEGDTKESKQKPLSAESTDVQGSASDVRNTLLSMSVLSPSLQLMETCPDSVLTNQPVSNATDKSEPSKAEEDNDEGDTKESKQKPSRAKSTDLQGSASDKRNTLLSTSVLSPSIQVIETCPDSVLTNRPISNASDKSETSKAEEDNDEGDTEESEQTDSCNKKDDSARREGGGDGGDGPNGESGSSGTGGGRHGGSNTDSGDNGGGYEHDSVQGDGDLGDGSQGNECGNSENTHKLNDNLPIVECSLQAEYEESRTKQNSNNTLSKSIFNCPSRQRPRQIGKKVLKCWYGDLEDDVLEIDDSVLFCGICGLDEDTCLCPLSTLAPIRTQSGRSLPTCTKLNTNENSLSVSSRKRLFSAPGAMQHNRTASDDGDSNLSSDDNKIVLEYIAMLGHQESTGFYSSELASLSRKHCLKNVPSTYFLLRGVSVTSGEERQRADVGKPDVAVAGGACKSELLESASPRSNDDGVSAEDLFESKLKLERKMWRRYPRADPNTLEVVAQAKTISKLRSAKNKPTRQPAPFPPLCFRINVRPPSGKLFYFAYGVNMNPKRMTTYLGCPVERRWGVLFGFKLKFNKKGSDLEAGGFPNIEFDPESSVEGCVYVITQTQLNTLNMFMGCPEFYTCAMFPVWMSNSYQPEEFGVAQYCVPALTYIAQDKWTHTDSTKPLSCHYSVDQCLKGSNLLTTDYVHHIKAQAVG